MKVIQTYLFCPNTRLVTMNFRKLNYSSANSQSKYQNNLISKMDMIGPPDPVSNLRRINFYIPPYETPLQYKYRTLRSNVQDWNQQFWHDHNKKFVKEREAFIASKLPPGKTTLTADELSVFYKSFLDKNWKLHTTYNIEWYKKNITILILSIRVQFEKIINQIKL